MAEYDIGEDEDSDEMQEENGQSLDDVAFLNGVAISDSCFI